MRSLCAWYPAGTEAPKGVRDRRVVMRCGSLASRGRNADGPAARGRPVPNVDRWVWAAYGATPQPVVGQVWRVPAFIAARALSSDAWTSGPNMLALSWNGEAPIPSLTAL